MAIRIRMQPLFWFFLEVAAVPRLWHFMEIRMRPDFTCPELNSNCRLLDRTNDYPQKGPGNP